MLEANFSKNQPGRIQLILKLLGLALNPAVHTLILLPNALNLISSHCHSGTLIHSPFYCLNFYLKLYHFTPPALDHFPALTPVLHHVCVSYSVNHKQFLCIHSAPEISFFHHQ